MPSKIRTQLNNSEFLEVSSLIAQCSGHDGLRYYLYTGDADFDDLFVLHHEDSILVGYAYLCKGEPAEISGLVLPRYRRQHIFSRMTEALAEHSGIDSYEFSGHSKYPGFAECAAALGAPHRHDEHLMRFSGHSLPHSDISLDYSVEQKDDTVFFFSRDNTEIGCVALAIEGKITNICNVYVEPDYRGQGYGYAMMCTVLSELFNYNGFKPNKGFDTLLQVSGSNKPAMALYAKCGFDIIDTVTFYSKSE